MSRSSWLMMSRIRFIQCTFFTPPRMHMKSSNMRQPGFVFFKVFALWPLISQGWLVRPHLPASTSASSKLQPPSSSPRKTLTSSFHGGRCAEGPRVGRLSASSIPPFSAEEGMAGNDGRSEEERKHEEELAAFLKLRKDARGGTPIDR